MKELVKQEGLWILELWHGPTYAFKDVALQFLGNLFEYFLVQENEGKTGEDRDHLTVLGATSGDTGRYAQENSTMADVVRRYTDCEGRRTLMCLFCIHTNVSHLSKKHK